MEQGLDRSGSRGGMGTGIGTGGLGRISGAVTKGPFILSLML